jgi:hypothetical protein
VVRVCGARLARATASEEMDMLTPEAHRAMLQIWITEMRVRLVLKGSAACRMCKHRSQSASAAALTATGMRLTTGAERLFATLPAVAEPLWALPGMQRGRYAPRHYKTRARSQRGTQAQRAQPACRRR